MKSLHMLAWLLLVVGGLNWGLIGLLNFNLVTTLFGSVPVLERVVYILVGAAGVYELLNSKELKLSGKK